ncbi:hypothetical protein, partial [Jiangella rhizosphaerae]
DPTETTSETPQPTLTAPPSETPEDEAAAAITEAFELLIADLDAYFSSAGDYSIDDITANPPTAAWPITGDADFEIQNWVTSWRQQELEAVGTTTVVAHDITSIDLEGGTASSVACRDMTAVTFANYSGEPVEPPFEPTQYQTWQMTWIYEPEAAPDAGIETAGWYLQEFNLALDEPC